MCSHFNCAQINEHYHESIIWLEHLARTEHRFIKHAAVGGEQWVTVQEENGGRMHHYRVDGEWTVEVENEGGLWVRNK